MYSTGDVIDQCCFISPLDKDESSGSNEAYIIAGVGGFVILSVIIIVIVVVIVLMKKHSRSR